MPCSHFIPPLPPPQVALSLAISKGVLLLCVASERDESQMLGPDAVFATCFFLGTWRFMRGRSSFSMDSDESVERPISDRFLSLIAEGVISLQEVKELMWIGAACQMPPTGMIPVRIIRPLPVSKENHLLSMDVRRHRGGIADSVTTFTS